MATVRTLVLRAAGTNCDLETVHAFERAGSTAERVHVNRLRENPALLGQYQILAIPGGFTYGDDLGAGRVLANELRLHLAEPLQSFLQRGGLAIGICNGFQVLVKAGLLPATTAEAARSGVQEATLAGNDSGRFEARWIWLDCVSDKTPFLRKGDRMHLPTAHGEGKFMSGSPEVRARLSAQDQVVLRYVDRDGRPGAYPVNPSGSEDDIAGVCDPTGRIFGLMPHPERHIEFHHHPRWTREGIGPEHEGDGLRVFRNAVEHLK
jgi:phosphoribosylformylglycinamidine synthase subunit PurQ / glutaminase